MSRKGSLELSVNSIVILILAIVILGLGIGFIKNMFDSTTSQITDIGADAAKRMQAKLEQSPDRLVIDPDNIELRAGSTKEVYFGLRNELSDRQTFSFNGNGKIDTAANPGLWDGSDSVIACYNSIDGVTLTGKNVKTEPVWFRLATKYALEPGKSQVGVITVQTGGRAKASTYNCAWVIKDPGAAGEYARKELLVTISG